MRAYYEIETDIPANHQLQIRLPDDIPAGRAKIAVIYELSERQPAAKNVMAEFLFSLPDNGTPGLSREQIQAYIEEERASWDD